MTKTKLITLLFFIVIATCQTSNASQTPEQRQMFDFSTTTAVPDFLQKVHVLQSDGKTLVLGGVTVTDASANKTVYQLDKKTGNWSAIGDLSFSLTEGSAVSWEDKLLCIDSSSKVFELSLSNKGITEKQIAPLDQPLKNQQATITSNRLYVSGIAADASGDSNPKLFTMDLLNKEPKWESLPTWPSQNTSPWIQSGLYGKLYIFSDENAFERTTDGIWKQLPLTDNSLQGYTAIPCGHAHILFIKSGSDQILAFHAITRMWIDTWKLPQAVQIAGVLANQIQFEILGYDKSIAAKAIIPQGGKNLLNYVIIVIFVAAMIYMGLYLSKREKNTNEYFRAGGRIPWWASGLSMFATGASALSLMAMPGKSYAEDWIFIGMTVAGVIIALPLSLLVFAPLIRRLDIATSNEYLERRFNFTLRLCGSVLFAIFQLMGRLAGIMILPAIALSSIFGISMEVSILVMGIATTAYVYIGGLEGVIWTDVIQAFLMVGTIVICIIWALCGLNMSPDAALSILQNENKLRAVEWAINWGRPCAIVMFLNVLVASLYSIGDQNFIQRVQCTKSAKEANKAILTQVAVAVPLNIILFIFGTLLFLFYFERPDALSPAVKNDGVYPLFAAQFLPAGLAGLVIVSILAATMSTVSSALNSVSNVIVEDLYRRLFKNATDKNCLMMGHILTALVGIVGTAAALFLAKTNFTSIWDMIAAATGMILGSFVGVFTLGIFTKRANSTGAICGVIAAIAATIWTQTHTHISPFMYQAVGLAACLIVGYTVSLIVPTKPKDITGLTVFTLPKK